MEKFICQTSFIDFCIFKDVGRVLDDCSSIMNEKYLGYLTKVRGNKNENESNPDYGAGAHYLGDEGELYFADQQITGALSAVWNLSYFLPYVNPSDAILDFGCGGGDLLARLPGRLKTGVEINPVAQEYAKKLGLQMFSSLDETPKTPYDVIISSHALEHVPEPLTLLMRLKDFLSSNGSLVLLLPMDDWRAPAHRTFKREYSQPFV
ncbi:MAG: class I SAM-dependent methyltransferase [Chloroflexi bacterium]|nr:class I SAM-dependent methyltransferase [Chloroflexota bacterium]